MAMAKAAKDNSTLLIVPNAGADAVTGPMCAPNIFRSSFSNWQPGYAMGEVAGQEGRTRSAMTITWKYAAGDESVKGFKEAFEKGGGKVVKELTLPFPNVEFQALLTEIAAHEARRGLHLLRRRRRGQVRQGLRGRRPARRRSRSTARASSPTARSRRRAPAQGLLTTLHYADSLDTPRDNAFRLAYARPTSAARRLRGAGLRRGADAGRRASRRSRATSSKSDELAAAMRKAQDRQPARHVHALGQRTTRCRTSTCARSRARKTRSSASPSRRWPTRRRGCKL